MKTMRILGIAGSLRRASYNRAALRAAVELAPAGVEIETFDLAAIPLYNGDVQDAGFPEPVLRFKERIAAADALLIATPEYNYSIPGVLKNAIDWASRPAGESPLAGKPLGIMGASMGGFGTARSQIHLRDVCVFVDLHPLNWPQVYISRAQDKFGSDGRLTDETTRDQIRGMIEALAAWTRRLQRGGAAADG